MRRGGGIIFLVGIWIWCLLFGFDYPWFVLAVILVAGVSFIDDIHSLPDLHRLVCQFIGMCLVVYQLVMCEYIQLTDLTWYWMIAPPSPSENSDFKRI